MLAEPSSWIGNPDSMLRRTTRAWAAGWLALGLLITSLPTASAAEPIAIDTRPDLSLSLTASPHSRPGRHDRFVLAQSP